MILSGKPGRPEVLLRHGVCKSQVQPIGPANAALTFYCPSCRVDVTVYSEEADLETFEVKLVPLAPIPWRW